MKPKAYGDKESAPFVKSRDLAASGAVFTVEAIRRGAGNYGPALYLDITIDGQAATLGVGEDSAIGGQIARVGEAAIVGHLSRVVARHNTDLDKPIYLLGPA